MIPEIVLGLSTVVGCGLQRITKLSRRRSIQWGVLAILATALCLLFSMASRTAVFGLFSVDVYAIYFKLAVLFTCISFVFIPRYTALPDGVFSDLYGRYVAGILIIGLLGMCGVAIRTVVPAVIFIVLCASFMWSVKRSRLFPPNVPQERFFWAFSTLISFLTLSALGSRFFITHSNDAWISLPVGMLFLVVSAGVQCQSLRVPTIERFIFFYALGALGFNGAILWMKLGNTAAMILVESTLFLLCVIGLLWMWPHASIEARKKTVVQMLYGADGGLQRWMRWLFMSHLVLIPPTVLSSGRLKMFLGLWEAENILGATLFLLITVSVTAFSIFLLRKAKLELSQSVDIDDGRSGFLSRLNSAVILCVLLFAGLKYDVFFEIISRAARIYGIT